VYLDNERRPAITPQLAIRVAIIGGVALVLFAVIFFRLWYLQVLSGDHYLAEANDNRVREIKVQAPRGEIVDRQGRVLVDNRNGYAVRITPDKLPRTGEERSQLYHRLGRAIGLSPREIRHRVNKQLKLLPFSAATIKQDVGLPVVYYLLERQEKLPGVAVEQVFLRSYPRHTIGAHLFGTVGEVTREQLKEQRYRGVKQGDRVGQSGIESSYDRFLRGKNGATRLQVDALGKLRERLGEKRPVQGRRLRLGIDLDVQKVGQQALGGRKGAFVVMDVHSGEVRALGSSPSYDPNIFSKTIKQSDYNRLSSKANGEPLADRAIQGLYPRGSTFKLITATAALESGLITPGTALYDGGSIKVGGVTFKNAGGGGHGSLALRQALTVSSDVFFYRLGLDANGAGDGHAIQRWAGRLGIGKHSGIDLPADAKGLVPSPEWRNREFRRHNPLINRPWSVGDNINLAVGQGDLQTNPLQMAVAYSAIANGGYIVKPHLGQRIEDADGRVLQEFKTPSRRKLNIKPEFRQAILEGLHGAASAPGGTSTDVFKDFKIPVAGKTGTAEAGAGRADHSWYIALAPFPRPRYAAAVIVENGGWGAEAAAPAARRILAALYGLKRDTRKIVKGASRTF
jgi:penicillin-binding protein 2